MESVSSILLFWFVAVAAVFVFAMVDNVIKQGRRFTLSHMMVFTTLIAVILGLMVVALRR
jgi:hypothetical protein